MKVLLASPSQIEICKGSMRGYCTGSCFPCQLESYKRSLWEYYTGFHESLYRFQDLNGSRVCSLGSTEILMGVITRKAIGSCVHLQYTYEHTFIYIYIYMHIYIFTYIHVCIYIFAYKYVCMYVCRYVYIHTYIHTYQQTRTHICIHVYVYVCMYVCFQGSFSRCNGPRKPKPVTRSHLCSEAMLTHEVNPVAGPVGLQRRRF